MIFFCGRLHEDGTSFHMSKNEAKKEEKVVRKRTNKNE